MIESIIAVSGTLLGTVAAYLLQQRASRTERAEARAADQRREITTAVTQLAPALADHRRTMWVREDLRLSGAAPEDYQAARAASHATRAALTAPLVTLQVLAPELAGAANEAAQAAYALRGAVDAATLTALREMAIAAADRLVAEAARRH